MQEEQRLWDEANPYFVDRKLIKPEGYTEAPLFKSTKEIKHVKKRNERILVGLTAEPIDIKDHEQDPGLGFIKSPSINCKSQLELCRRKTAFEEAKVIEKSLDEFIEQK